MANTFTSPAQRVGKIKGQTLKHAIHSNTLEISGEIYTQPIKKGDTVIFRQVVPFGATAANPNTFTLSLASHLMQEGQTPNAETLDTSVTVQKFGALYTYTEKEDSLGEDEIPEWMEEQLGERMGLLRELIYIGALQGCTNRFYSGGSTRATTKDPLSLLVNNRVTRNLASNHAKFVKKAVSSDIRYGSVSLQKCYLAFGHTDLQQDIESIPGYKPVSDYGKMMDTAHDMEIGCVGSIRYILNPEMPKFADAGAAVSGTTNNSTSGTFSDVYQLFVIAKDAWGHTLFRGLNAFKYNHIPVGQIDKSDPTGERGYCSTTFYDAGVITNHGWMALVEVTASNQV
jgi:N4-gp56 family major capsid protein